MCESHGKCRYIRTVLINYVKFHITGYMLRTRHIPITLADPLPNTRQVHVKCLITRTHVHYHARITSKTYIMTGEVEDDAYLI